MVCFVGVLLTLWCLLVLVSVCVIFFFCLHFVCHADIFLFVGFEFVLVMEGL